jgi:hypothetical protein
LCRTKRKRKRGKEESRERERERKIKGKRGSNKGRKMLAEKRHRYEEKW